MALKKRKAPKPKLADDPKVQEAAAFAMRGVAAQKAVDMIIPQPAKPPAARAGPSKTQVCDAVRGAAPGLPFAAVDRVAAAVMKLYGR